MKTSYNMKNLILFSPLILYLLFTGCATIPKEASSPSLKVTEGIQKMQAGNEKIIKALADTERVILEDKWSDICSKAEKLYSKNHKILEPRRLKKEDLQNIANIAAKTRDTILDEIAKHETELIDQSRSNAGAVLSMNTEVIGYLNSHESIKETQNKINKIFEKLPGINPNVLRGTVERSMKSLLNPD